MSPGRAVEVLWVAFNDLGFPGSHLGSVTTISQTGETAPDKSVRIGHRVLLNLGNGWTRTGWIRCTDLRIKRL